MSYEKTVKLRLFKNFVLHREKLDPKKLGNKKFTYKNLYTKDNI